MLELELELGLGLGLGFGLGFGLWLGLVSIGNFPGDGKPTSHHVLKAFVRNA